MAHTDIVTAAGISSAVGFGVADRGELSHSASDGCAGECDKGER
jgi:hypothetical protein